MIKAEPASELTEQQASAIARVFDDLAYAENRTACATTLPKAA